MFLMVTFVVLAPITARYGVNDSIFRAEAGHPNSFLSPRSEAWFGTDAIGRDLYSRLIYGLRVSLVIGLFAAIFATVVGLTVGAIAGLRGGVFDDILMRVTDIFLAFPFLVALLVVRNFLGALGFLEPIVGPKTSLRFIILLFTIFGWMGVARLVRGQILALKEREFVEAARALGSSDRRIVVKHLLPERRRSDPRGAHDRRRGRGHRRVDVGVLRVRSRRRVGQHVARQPRQRLEERGTGWSVVARDLPVRSARPRRRLHQLHR